MPKKIWVANEQKYKNDIYIFIHPCQVLKIYLGSIWESKKIKNKNIEVQFWK
jgi:hypothetical protein